jgi:carbon monoxide dehydrogenase subunit G
MIQFENSIFIKRSPQDVFAYVTNPNNAPQWMAGVQDAEWTSDDHAGVGSTWKVTTKFLGRTIEGELERTRFDPPTHVTSKVIRGPIPYESTFKLTAQDNGTLLAFSGQVEFGGFFKLAEGLVGQQLKKHQDADLAALKLLLEAEEA